MNTYRVTFTLENGKSEIALCRSMEIAIRATNRAFEVLGNSIVGIAIEFV